MGKARFWLLTTVMIAVAGIVLWTLFSSGARMPQCQGKPLDVWLDERIVSGDSEISSGKADLARIGPAAVPIILRILSRYDSPSGHRYRRFWAGMPLILQRHLPAPQTFHPVAGNIETQALRASCDSPQGARLLVDVLKDANPAVREAAASALSSLSGGHYLSESERLAVFTPLLKDTDAAVAQTAMFAIDSCREIPSDTIALYVGLLQRRENGRNSDGRNHLETVPIRGNAAFCLAQMGPMAKQAVPALKYLGTTGDPYQKLAAAKAVWCITSNTDFSLPVLLSEMPRIAKPMKPVAVDVLAEMGPRAAAAIPLLTGEYNAWKNTGRPWDLEESNSLRHALMAIDPRAAARVGVK
jgi:hypothetical protein